MTDTATEQISSASADDSSDNERQPGADPLATKAQAIRALLSRETESPERSKKMRKALRDPEVRKNLDRLGTAIEELRRLPTPQTPGTQLRFETLNNLLIEAPLEPIDADSLGLLLETVDQDLAVLGTDVVLATQLQFEEQRDGTPDPGWVALWGDERTKVFQTIAAGNATTEEVDAARRTLQVWYGSRHQRYTLERSREEARARRLRALVAATTLLVGALVVLVHLIAENASIADGLLVACLGALGATIGLAYRIRDTAPRLRSLRTFNYGFALQASLGATAGIVVWILLQSGLVDLGNDTTQWAVYAIVAFVAGFSEPFFLKTVESIAGLNLTPSTT